MEGIFRDLSPLSLLLEVIFLCVNTKMKERATCDAFTFPATSA